MARRDRVRCRRRPGRARTCRSASCRRPRACGRRGRCGRRAPRHGPATSRQQSPRALPQRERRPVVVPKPDAWTVTSCDAPCVAGEGCAGERVRAQRHDGGGKKARYAHRRMVPFSATVSPVTAAELRYSYRPGCPVVPAQLRRVALRYWGFDGASHVGSLVVNDAVDARRRRARSGGSTPSGSRSAACGRSTRTAAATTARWRRTTRRRSTAATRSRRARSGGRCTRTARRSTSTRSRTRISKAARCGRPPASRTSTARASGPAWRSRGGALVAAFALVGWPWGGRWTGSPDYQHFSKTGG